MQGKQQKCKKGGGGEVFSFIVEKQPGSVFAGNWPRLQTSINQNHARASNKDTAVVTLQQIHYFQTHTLVTDILIHNNCISHHWLAATPPRFLDLPQYVLLYWVAHIARDEEPPHQARLRRDFHLIEAFMRVNRLHFESERPRAWTERLKSFQREIYAFSRFYFKSMGRISERSEKDKFSVAAV